MKKFIAIALVLAIVPLASAGLVWDANYDAGTKTVTAVLNSDVNLKAINVYQMITDTAGTFSATSAFTGSGTAWTFTDTMGSGYSGNLVLGDAVGVSGDILTVSLVLNDVPVDGIVSITFPVGPVPALQSYVTDMSGIKANITGFDVAVPEPMTMALLGLGGLFIRRRRA